MIRILNKTQLRNFWHDREAEDSVANIVAGILSEVRRKGDAALIRFTRKFDGFSPKRFRVPESELKKAWGSLDLKTKITLKKVASNIREFSQLQKNSIRETALSRKGFELKQLLNPLRRVGIYVPGGRYPLPSTVMMGAIPAQVAGVSEIAVCTPPSRKGEIHPAILGACIMLGIDEVHAVGGAQAIGALAYGTQSVTRVDKIAGPGNRFVAEAKAQVAKVCGIDMYAGPTEVLVIADFGMSPDILAADLLGQAEHGPDSTALAIVFSDAQAKALRESVMKQKNILSFEPRVAITVVKNLREAFALSEEFAPEHLQLCIKDAKKNSRQLNNFGSLFIGYHTPSVLGDYALGPNHTLPTSGAARFRGGLSVFDFLKIQTSQRVADAKTYSRRAELGIAMAELEGLKAHANALRLGMRK